MTRLLSKQPGEKLSLEFALRDVVTLDGVAQAARGLVAGSASLSLAPGLVSGVPHVTASGGTDGEQYLVTVECTLASGEIREDAIELMVLEGGWIMPDGGTAYLTITEFVRKCGIEEVIAQTDPNGSGRIDRDYLIEKLIDAQSLVDSNLAGRYQTPLSIVPPSIKTAIADIARARMYRHQVPDNVAQAAKDAIRQLERIAEGKLQLPLAAGESVESASNTPILIAPGRRRYPPGSLDF